MAHHAYSGWVQVGGAWALCVLHFHVSPWPICCSCVCLGLWIDLILLRILLLKFLTLCGMEVSLGLHSLHLISSLGWAGLCLSMGSSFFNLAPAFFMVKLTLLPYRLITSTMLSFNSCLLGLLWAYHILFFYSVHIAQYFYWAYFHTILGFLCPFHTFRHPRPASLLWASLAHSITTFPWVFAKSFELP